MPHPAICFRSRTTTRRPRLFLSLLVALACSSGAQQLPETATPAPATDIAQQSMLACVDSAFASTAIVDHARTQRRVGNPASRYLKLRNSPSPRVPGVLFSLAPSRGAPRQLVIEYTWPASSGTSGMQPPPDPKASEFEGQLLTDVVVQLLQLVRSSCAPDALGEPACSKVAEGRRGRCVLGT
jgi:hypothetical protein